MNASQIAHRLPGPAAVRELSRRTTLLEFLIAPGTRYRKYDFVTVWRSGWDLARMRNGGGDECFIALSDSAGLIRCFDHESEVSPYANEGHEFWPGTVDALPSRFRPILEDPGFTGGDRLSVTALLWFLPGDTAWRTGVTGDQDDGTGWMLEHLYSSDPGKVHHSLFQDYYQRPVDLFAVRAFMGGEVLTEELVAALNPGVDATELFQEVVAYRS